VIESGKLFEARMRESLSSLYGQMSADQKKQLDAEVERITLRDCDEVPRVLNRREFESVARAAVENIRKRKKTNENDERLVAAYA